MILRQDLAFSSDMLIELLSRFRETDDIHDLNSFVENEPLQTLSIDDLKTRFEKSLNIYIEILELILNTNLDKKSLVIIASIAIDIANRESTAEQKLSEAEINVGKKHQVTAEDKDKISRAIKTMASFNCAVGLFGSEEHVAIRRQLVLLAERVTNLTLLDNEIIESGSFAEGICYPGSDMDKMICTNSQRIIKDVRKGFNDGDLLMIPTSPCYCLLIDLTNNITQNDVCIILGLPIYSSKLLLENKAKSLHGMTIHGPCLATKVVSLDYDAALCIKCSFWPQIANEWINRTRIHGWPTPEMIKVIVTDGCHVVPTGNSSLHGNRLTSFLSEEERLFILSRCSSQRECLVLDEQTFQLHDHEWRLSFSHAERYLMHSLNHTQFLVYNLLRLALKKMIEQSVRDVLCSYFMKTILFFTIEKSENAIWCSERLDECYRKCVMALLKALNTRTCPNYFVAGNNMFQKLHRIRSSHYTDLLRIVEELQMSGVFGLLSHLENGFFLSSCTDNRCIEQNLDSDWFNPFISNFGSSLLLCLDRSQSNENSMLKMIRTMILEVGAFRDNQIQDYIIAVTVTCFCQMLMHKMSQFQTGSEMNTKARQDIESLLRNLEAGDVTTKPLTYASYLYLIGDTKSATSVLQQLLSEYPSHIICVGMSAESVQAYMMNMCGKGFTIGYKFRRSLTPLYTLDSIYCNAAPMPIRLLIAIKRHFAIDPLTYAYFLLALCEANDNKRLIIDTLKEKMMRSQSPRCIAEMKMCLGILEMVHGRNEEAIGWFYSVYLTNDKPNDDLMYSFAPMMYISCLLFKLWIKMQTKVILYQRDAS